MLAHYELGACRARLVPSEQFVLSVFISFVDVKVLTVM